MKLTIAQVLGAVSALNELAGKAFPPATSLRIARLSARLQPEADLAEKQRLALIEKAGAKLSEDRRAFEFPDEAAGRKFEAEWREVLATEIDVHVDPLPLQALGSTELTPATMKGLLPLLEEEAARPEIVKKKKAG